MALRYIGKDPDSPNNGSPTVWVDEEDGSLVLQGWKITDEATLVIWNHFAGDGSSTGRERCEDAVIAKQCVSAFDAVWERAISHEQYQPG